MIQDEVILKDGTVVEFGKYTVEEVFNALAENGFEHLRSQWMNFNESDYNQLVPITGACVLGQAALNLNVIAVNEPDEANVAPYPVETFIEYDWLDSEFEDYRAVLDPYTQNLMTIEAQLNRFTTDDYESKWYLGADTGVASTVIYWNDKQEDYETQEYALKTYQEVVNMAYDVMKPFFHEIVYLAPAVYNSQKVNA